MKLFSLALRSTFLVTSLAAAGAAGPAGLKVVGVLANSAGMGETPFPYALYEGVAVDAKGRVYLCGPLPVVPVADQDGSLVALLSVPGGLRASGAMCRTGDDVFFLARDGNRAALHRIRAGAAGPGALKVEATDVTLGPESMMAPSLGPGGSLVILDTGPANAANPTVVLKACDPERGGTREIFSKTLQGGAGWHHRFVEVHPDGLYRIDLHGRSELTGWFDGSGVEGRDLPVGQVLGKHIYRFGYHGAIQRFDLAGKEAPGECGSVSGEIRHARQVAKWTGPDGDERYFFAGRGGALEAEWNGTTFVYRRRIGSFWVQDLDSDRIDSGGRNLVGLAYIHQPHADIRRLFTMGKTKPLAKPIDIGDPFYKYAAVSSCAVRDGQMVAWEKPGAGAGVAFFHSNGRDRYEAELGGVSRVGQIADHGDQVYIVDLGNGKLLRCGRGERGAVEPVDLGREALGGLAAAAFDERGRLYVASARQVQRLDPEGGGWKVAWTSPETYEGVRRLSASGERVFVCDAPAHVVDQLDARDRKLAARLGVRGEKGSDLAHLDTPVALAADANGVYVADQGNARILVATDTLWRPEIARLPREDRSPLVAARFTVSVPPARGNVARLSVNIFDRNDLTVRQLVCAEERKPGPCEILWDGRDDLGNFCEPDTYRWHAGVAPELRLEYVTSVGQSGNPPYRTADGRGSWGGVWGNVADVCPVGDTPGTDIVVIWIYEEGEGLLVRMSPDGEVRWKQHGQWTGRAYTTVACDGKTVYVGSTYRTTERKGDVAEKGVADVWRVDAETGRYLDGGSHWKTYGPEREEAVLCHDIAVKEGRFYVTNTPAGELYVGDKETGELLDTYRVPGVSGVAFGTDGRLLVSAGRRIVELGDHGDVKRTVVRDAGGTVWDIDVTPDGLVAATVGEGRHQVVFFDGRGREVRAVGGKGGRPGAGKMQPASFLEPTGLGVMPSGRFFVAENAAPRRFTRWSAQGKLEKQFHGPYYYSGMFGIDEEEPEYVYGDTHGDFIRYRVDYRTGKWDVDHYWIGAWEQSGVPAKWWPRIRRRGGRVYWCSGSGGIVELKEDGVRGVAAVYGGAARVVGGEVVQGNDARGSDMMATWSDLNGDGEKQLEEWNVTESAYPVRSGGPQQGWGSYFDEDFNLFMADWSDNEAGGVWQIPVVEWKGDVPVYRWDRARRVGVPKRDWPQHSGAGTRTVYSDGKAAYGFTAAYNAAGFPGVGHGRDWEFLRIGKYDPETGAPVWHAGRRAPGFAASGEMYCPTGPSGKIGELLFWTDENSLVHVIDDRHGLYVGALLEDVSRGPAPGPYTVWVELFNTRTFRHPGTGRVYLIAASDAIHIFEVLGTGTPIGRMSGQVRLDAAGIAKVKERLARSEAGGRRSCRIVRARGRVEVDGDLGEFARAEPMAMVISEDARGAARVMYDERNLYVAFDVADSSPLANTGSDPGLAFKTGDTVDVYLGRTPPAARKDGLPVEGDVHLLFTRQEGKDLAVGYWPASKQEKRREFRSPSGRTVIERVEVLTGAAVASRVRQGGYRLEAAVPLSLLGFEDVKPGDEIGLDVAINFSDPAGGANVAKMFWGRGSAGMVYDIPTEVRLEPETWGVGVVE